MGQPHLHRLFTGIRSVIIIIIIYPAIKWFSLTGAASAVFISTVVSYFFQVTKMRKLTDLDTLKYGRIFVQGAGLALIVIVIWLFTPNIFGQNPINNLIFGTMGCGLMYGMLIILYFKLNNVLKYIKKEASLQ